MKRLRTLVVMHSTLVPPDSLEGHSEKEIEEWRIEFDVVSTLKKSGHEVRCLGISDSLEELRLQLEKVETAANRITASMLAMA